MSVDTSGIASNVLGIAGMGIGLGLLAHTASNIARSTDRMYDQGREEPRPRRKYARDRHDNRGEGFGRYPRQEPRKRFGSDFGSSSFRFNPQPIKLSEPSRSFRW